LERRVNVDLCSSHVHDFKATTQDTLYETYRTQKLSSTLDGEGYVTRGLAEDETDKNFVQGELVAS